MSTPFNVSRRAFLVAGSSLVVGSILPDSALISTASAGKLTPLLPLVSFKFNPRRFAKRMLAVGHVLTNGVGVLSDASLSLGAYLGRFEKSAENILNQIEELIPERATSLHSWRRLGRFTTPNALGRNLSLDMDLVLSAPQGLPILHEVSKVVQAFEDLCEVDAALILRVAKSVGIQSMPLTSAQEPTLLDRYYIEHLKLLDSDDNLGHASKETITNLVYTRGFVDHQSCVCDQGRLKHSGTMAWIYRNSDGEKDFLYRRVYWTKNNDGTWSYQLATS